MLSHTQTHTREDCPSIELYIAVIVAVMMEIIELLWVNELNK